MEQFSYTHLLQHEPLEPELLGQSAALQLARQVSELDKGEQWRLRREKEIVSCLSLLCSYWTLQHPTAEQSAELTSLSKAAHKEQRRALLSSYYTSLSSPSSTTALAAINSRLASWTGGSSSTSGSAPNSSSSSKKRKALSSSGSVVVKQEQEVGEGLGGEGETQYSGFRESKGRQAAKEATRKNKALSSLSTADSELVEMGDTRAGKEEKGRGRKGGKKGRNKKVTVVPSADESSSPLPLASKTPGPVPKRQKMELEEMEMEMHVVPSSGKLIALENNLGRSS